ncbi:MAG: heme o synthase [Longimicrobiales bacterium]
MPAISSSEIRGDVALAGGVAVQLPPQAVRAPAAPQPGALKTLIALTKPGITRLVVLTAAAGFYLANVGPLQWLVLAHTLLGVALAAAGANALNQYVERDVDAAMARTRARPLPAGLISARRALLFALALALGGTLYLAVVVNVTAALIVATSIGSYVLVYTPLKRRTSLCTLAGAVPGALPIVAGWAAAGRPLDAAAWSLFWILFLWQIPHFLALAWLYREDYARAGFAMLSRGDVDGRATGRQIVLYGVALLPASLLPTLLGLTGSLYFLGALILGGAFLALGAAVSLVRTERRARRLFLASVLYLPALLSLMVVDRL